MATPAGGVWPPGPVRPELANGAVHVWRADLEQVDDALQQLLDREERARADRLLSARDGRRWASARAVLRSLLGLYLELDPRGLQFQAGPHGKPALVPPAISFSLSHSGGLALYALAARGAVGVDIELSRHPRDVLAVAARAFGASEAERLSALAPALRERELLRAWVRHEAELKRVGVGLGAEGRPGDPEGGDSCVIELAEPADGAAAVALDTPPRELCCWAWPPQAGPPAV